MRQFVCNFAWFLRVLRPALENWKTKFKKNTEKEALKTWPQLFLQTRYLLTDFSPLEYNPSPFVGYVRLSDDVMYDDVIPDSIFAKMAFSKVHRTEKG